PQQGQPPPAAADSIRDDLREGLAHIRRASQVVPAPEGTGDVAPAVPDDPTAAVVEPEGADLQAQPSLELESEEMVSRRESGGTDGGGQPAAEADEPQALDLRGGGVDTDSEGGDGEKEVEGGGYGGEEGGETEGSERAGPDAAPRGVDDYDDDVLSAAADSDAISEDPSNPFRDGANALDVSAATSRESRESSVHNELQDGRDLDDALRRSVFSESTDNPFSDAGSFAQTSAYGGASESGSFRHSGNGNSAYGYGSGSVSMFSDSIRSEDEAPHWRGGTYGMAMDDGAHRGSARSRDSDASSLRRADGDGSRLDRSRAGRSSAGDVRGRTAGSAAGSRDGRAVQQAAPPSVYPDDDESQFDQSRAGRSAGDRPFRNLEPPSVYPDEDQSQFDQSRAGRSAATQSQGQGDFHHPEPPNVDPDGDESRFDQSHVSHQDRSAAGATSVSGGSSAAHDDEAASGRSSNIHPDDVSTADFSRRGGYRGAGPVIQAFDDESTYVGGESVAHSRPPGQEEQSAAGTSNIQPDDISTADFSRRGGYRGAGPVIQAFDDESTYVGGESAVNSRPPGQEEQSAAGTSNVKPDDISTADFSRRGGYRGAGPVIQAFDDESTYVGGESVVNSRPPVQEDQSAAGTSNVKPDDVSTADFSRRGGYRGAGPVIQAFDDESTFAGNSAAFSAGNSATYSWGPSQPDQSMAGASASLRSGDISTSEFSRRGGYRGAGPVIDPDFDVIPEEYDETDDPDPGSDPAMHHDGGYPGDESRAFHGRPDEYAVDDPYGRDGYEERKEEDMAEGLGTAGFSRLGGDDYAPADYGAPGLSYGENERQHEEERKHFDDGGHSQEEDIFQFRDPVIKTAPKDYHNYSDPVESEICPLAVRKVLKILRYFSRVLSAMEPLAQQSGLVDALLYHMTRKPRVRDYEDEVSSRVDAIAVVVNLACAEENKIMLVYHPGLLDAVINIANHDPIDECREHAAIVLMNLAYAEENKVHMVNQDQLLDTLVHLLSDVSPFTRRYASAALFTLACTYANTAVMARHCDGGILEALRKVLLNDPIDEARVNAAEALFNMARNNSDDTVENMGNHPRLLASLAHSVLTDYSADVRAYSARALEWLSADIHSPMPCHRLLLKALVLSSQWTKTTCIAEALKMQASLSENRKPMVEHEGLLDGLATLALLDGINDDEVKTCAICALERLSKESSTRHIMVQNEGVMTALTKATFDNDIDDEESDEMGTPTAILMKTALKNLAEHL
ncbi:hypothetical protein THAOC_23295, partial [Thalassiosira oceanica]